jgi:hypothetical protein
MLQLAFSNRHNLFTLFPSKAPWRARVSSLTCANKSQGEDEQREVEKYGEIMTKRGRGTHRVNKTRTGNKRERIDQQAIDEYVRILS